MKCAENYAQDGVIQGPFDQKGAIEKLCLDGRKLINTDGAYGIEGAEYHTEIESVVYVKQNDRSNPGALDLTETP